MATKTMCMIFFAAMVSSVLVFGAQPAASKSHMEPYLKLKLKDVRVSPSTPNASGEDPGEEVNLNFAPVGQSYQEQKKDGTQEEPKGSYDTRQNKRY